MIIVTAGYVNLLRVSMVREDTIVVDVGTNRLGGGKIISDVDFEEISKKASFIISVSGGVGLMTTTMLLENIIKSARDSLRSGV